MPRSHQFALRAAAIAIVGWSAAVLAPACVRAENPSAASTPAPGVHPSAGDWLEKFKALRQRAADGNVDLVFLGDSISEFWGNVGAEVWQQYYGERRAVSFGLSGDRTQNVLWRIEQGNFDGIAPKLVVLMIGSNNGPSEDTGEQIGEGIRAVVKALRTKLPKTKILVLAIFPRDAAPSPLREKLAGASQVAAQSADKKMVHFLDIGPAFLGPDGRISPEVMPDALHLSPGGYQLWAEAIEPTVARLLKQRPLATGRPAKQRPAKGKNKAS